MYISTILNSCPIYSCKSPIIPIIPFCHWTIPDCTSGPYKGFMTYHGNPFEMIMETSEKCVETWCFFTSGVIKHGVQRKPWTISQWFSQLEPSRNCPGIFQPAMFDDTRGYTIYHHYRLQELATTKPLYEFINRLQWEFKGHLWIVMNQHQFLQIFKTPWGPSHLNHLNVSKEWTTSRNNWKMAPISPSLDPRPGRAQCVALKPWWFGCWSMEKYPASLCPGWRNGEIMGLKIVPTNRGTEKNDMKWLE